MHTYDLALINMDDFSNTCLDILGIGLPLLMH